MNDPLKKVTVRFITRDGCTKIERLQVEPGSFIQEDFLELPLMDTISVNNGEVSLDDVNGYRSYKYIGKWISDEHNGEVYDYLEGGQSYPVTPDHGMKMKHDFTSVSLDTYKKAPKWLNNDMMDALNYSAYNTGSWWGGEENVVSNSDGSTSGG